MPPGPSRQLRSVLVVVDSPTGDAQGAVPLRLSLQKAFERPVKTHHPTMDDKLDRGPKQSVTTSCEDIRGLAFSSISGTTEVAKGSQMRNHKVQFLLTLALLFWSSAMFAQIPNTASAQLTTDTPHFHGGEEVSFTMKLNDPLPEGARFDVRLSPVGINQELSVSSTEPTDKSRKEFLLKFTLPEHARGGEWHIFTVYLFLPGASWVGNTITTNDLRFMVDGPDGPIPSSAVAKILKK
jgi:hypothetical protein